MKRLSTSCTAATWEGTEYTDVAGIFPDWLLERRRHPTLLNQAGFAGLLFVLGKISFFMLVPILSGFIAFGIADRPGLVPGIVGGLHRQFLGAGFLGGLVSGFIAGGLAYGLTRLKVPKGVRGIMPVVVIPLVTTIRRRRVHDLGGRPAHRRGYRAG